MADDAARGTKQVAGVAADEATSVAQEAKDQARSLWDQTSSQLSSQAADQKDTLVSWLRNLADELSSMADSAPRGSNGSEAPSSGQAGVATALAHRGADYAQRTASWLGDREPSAVLDEVGSFARRRPGAFLALAAAAGIVVGRLTRGLTSSQDDGDRPQQRRMVTPDVPVRSAGYDADVTAASSWAAAAARGPHRADRTCPSHGSRSSRSTPRVPVRRRPAGCVPRGRTVSQEQSVRSASSRVEDDRSVGELIAAVSQDFSTLMRQEVELAKAEVRESATRAGAGAGLLTGAGVAGHMVLLFLSIAAWWGIAQWIGQAWSGVVLAVFWAIVGLILYSSGRSRLKQVQGVPRTVETTKQIPDALAGKEDSR